MLAKGEDPCLYRKSAKLIYIIKKRESMVSAQRETTSIAASTSMRRKDRTFLPPIVVAVMLPSATRRRLLYNHGRFDGWRWSVPSQRAEEVATAQRDDGTGSVANQVKAIFLIGKHDASGFGGA